MFGKEKQYLKIQYSKQAIKFLKKFHYHTFEVLYIEKIDNRGQVYK